MPDPEAERLSGRTAEVIDLEPPPPPADAALDEKQTAEWIAVWQLPVARYWARSDLPVLERLFRLRQLHDTLLREFEDCPLVAGSKGQLVLNPLARQAKAVHAEVVALEDRFFLSPAFRMKGLISLAAAADGVKRHPEVLAEQEEKPKRADPRLARRGSAAP
jgi:hypothetical protein